MNFDDGINSNLYFSLNFLQAPNTARVAHKLSDVIYTLRCAGRRALFSSIFTIFLGFFISTSLRSAHNSRA